MKILICLSNVPDTTTKIRFVDNNTKFDTNGVQWIINPWDELALTRAVELKEKYPSEIENITVATVGLQDSEATMRKALAVGADKAIRINAEAKDAYFVASQLAEVVKAEAFDVVLAGIESSDYNGNAVGSMLSEILDYPSVSSVSKFELEGGQIILNREIDGGSEVLEVKAPIVAIVQKGIAIEPRIPAMRGIMMARSKPLNVVEPVAVEALTEHIAYELPPAKAACKIVDEENVAELVRLLHEEAKAI
jgi:electron transfer flavoprotein beta subunit